MSRLSHALAAASLRPCSQAPDHAHTQAYSALSRFREMRAQKAKIAADRPMRINSTIGPAAESAVPDLCAVLEDEDVGVCFAAVRSLGQIGPAARQQAVGPLQSLRGDKRSWFGTRLDSEASKALERIAPDGVLATVPR